MVVLGYKYGKFTFSHMIILHPFNSFRLSITSKENKTDTKTDRDRHRQTQTDTDT